ncbi:U1 zinc finger [Musa troglodytarum]|uniref:U1 zinc finger n=1 Tax=Musa troglodytarum TaxID=320322 RepID=A0A9E7LFY5_9LILI|nr:U1 zinc finger [Musa troglodytarum]
MCLRARKTTTVLPTRGAGDPTALVNSSIARENGSDWVSPEFGSDTDTDLIGHNPIRYGMNEMQSTLYQLVSVTVTGVCIYSYRTHELGQRHKDNVAKRLATMRKESAAREKEQKAAARALKEIETKAERSYQKDLASFQRVDTSTGLDSNKKKTDEAQCSAATTNENGAASKSKGGPAPGLVISTPLNPTRAVKGKPSSVAVNKRKRDDGKAKAISKEEAEALKAREAARKRMEEREKPFMGLYKSY